MNGIMFVSKNDQIKANVISGKQKTKVEFSEHNLFVIRVVVVMHRRQIFRKPYQQKDVMT